MPEDLEARLRRELSSWAEEAPPPRAVSVRTLDAAYAAPVERSRPAWLLSAIAACVLLVVIGGTVGGIALVRHLTEPTRPAAPTQPASPAPANRIGAERPSDLAEPNREPDRLCFLRATGTRGCHWPGPGRIHGARPDVRERRPGWALGTAPCSSNPCTSLVRTSDGGRSWVGIRPPVVGLVGVDDCSTACVSNVRFATPLVGYLFGPQVFYLTTDGGATWQRQVGGAAALEIADNNVLRVPAGDGQGCFPGCPVSVQVSTIGGTGVAYGPCSVVAQVGFDTGVQLSRTGGHAYLQVYGHVSGGASQAHSALYVSADSGLTWADRGETCPQVSPGEVDASALSSASDQSVTVLCTQRSGSASFVAVSTDGGRSFQARKAAAQPRNPGRLGVVVHRVRHRFGWWPRVPGPQRRPRPHLDRGGAKRPGDRHRTAARWLPRLRVGDNRPMGQPERSPHGVDDPRRRCDLGQLHIPA
jgi:hypothetical protein